MLLRHVEYRAEKTVFLQTVIQHEYSETGYLNWGCWMTGFTRQNPDVIWPDGHSVPTNFKMLTLKPCTKLKIGKF